jgi:hypothetical protein
LFFTIALCMSLLGAFCRIPIMLLFVGVAVVFYWCRSYDSPSRKGP